MFFRLLGFIPLLLAAAIFYAWLVVRYNIIKFLLTKLTFAQCLQIKIYWTGKIGEIRRWSMLPHGIEKRLRILASKGICIFQTFKFVIKIATEIKTFISTWLYHFPLWWLDHVKIEIIILHNKICFWKDSTFLKLCCLSLTHLICDNFVKSFSTEFKTSQNYFIESIFYEIISFINKLPWRKIFPCNIIFGLH